MNSQIPETLGWHGGCKSGRRGKEMKVLGSTGDLFLPSGVVRPAAGDQGSQLVALHPFYIRAP